MKKSTSILWLFTVPLWLCSCNLGCDLSKSKPSQVNYSETSQKPCENALEIRCVEKSNKTNYYFYVNGKKFYESSTSHKLQSPYLGMVIICSTLLFEDVHVLYLDSELEHAIKSAKIGTMSSKNQKP